MRNEDMLIKWHQLQLVTFLGIELHPHPNVEHAFLAIHYCLSFMIWPEVLLVDTMPCHSEQLLTIKFAG